MRKYNFSLACANVAVTLGQDYQNLYKNVKLKWGHNMQNLKSMF